MRRDRVRNDGIDERVGVALIEEKLVQHRLRWFGHIQHMPPEASVHSGRFKRVANVREVCKERSEGLECHERTSHG